MYVIKKIKTIKLFD